MSQRTTSSLIIFVLLAVVCTVPAHADKVKVFVAGGYEDITAYQQEQVTFISLSEFAEVVGGSIAWEIVGHQARYVDGTTHIDFLLDSPFMKMGDTVYNITYQSFLRDGQLFVPVVTTLPILDRVFLRKLVWSPGDRTIRAESEYFNVTDMSVQAKSNGLLIEIFLTTALNYQIFVTEGNWLNVSIRDAKVNGQRILSRKNPRYMYNLKVHQVENNTGQISMRLKRKVENWHHKILYDPPRIQISIPDVDFELDTATDAPVIGPDEKIDVIVVDAGHGGQDYGAIGPKGTREKDVVLEIAKRLAKLIRKDKQFKVIMTRDRDEAVSLERRAKIANDAGADLFISIHANASPRSHVRGWNVFFLAPARNDSARSVEQLENSYFIREFAASSTESNPDLMEDPVLGILNEMLLTEFQAESNDFALIVDREFRRHLETPARGVDQAGFFVLNKVFTPSVLVEAAFISNKNEEKLLKSKSYQEKVAEGIYEAIKRFKTKYESR